MIKQKLDSLVKNTEIGKLVAVCSACNAVREADSESWITREQVIAHQAEKPYSELMNSNSKTHTYCPICLEEEFKKLYA